MYTAAAANTAFSTLDLADFIGAMGQLPEMAMQNAKWFMSRTAYLESVGRLAGASGGLTTEVIPEGPSQVMFLGLPVVFVPVLNSTTGAQVSTNVLCVGDLSQTAVLGTRPGLAIASSNQRYLETDSTAIRGTQRFDISIHGTGDASNAESMIVLATPGS